MQSAQVNDEPGPGSNPGTTSATAVAVLHAFLRLQSGKQIDICSMNICIQICIHIFMYMPYAVCVYMLYAIYREVCKYCIHVCMYLCMYVCMYLYMYIEELLQTGKKASLGKKR